MDLLIMKKMTTVKMEAGKIPPTVSKGEKAYPKHGISLSK
jgi:hypothetical protein